VCGMFRVLLAPPEYEKIIEIRSGFEKFYYFLLLELSKCKNHDFPCFSVVLHAISVENRGFFGGL